jgi:hypothetical protein
MMTAMDDAASSQDVLTLQLDTPMYDGGVEINLKKYFALQDRLLQDVVTAQETGETGPDSLSLSDPKIQAQYVRRLGRVSRLFQGFEPLTRQDFGWTPYPSATNLPRIEDLMRGMGTPARVEPPSLPNETARPTPGPNTAMFSAEGLELTEPEPPPSLPNPVARYVAEGPVTLLVSLMGFIISGVALFCGWLTRNEELLKRGTGLCQLCASAFCVGVQRALFLTGKSGGWQHEHIPHTPSAS